MTYNTINDAQTMAGGKSALGRIDQYELVRELGGGGFGTVYLAKDTVAGIEVAVKGLPPLIRNNAEELERIRENFALVSRLHHPYIAAALHLQLARDVAYASDDVGQKLRVMPGDTLMVMEYAPGVTLSKWRKQFPGGKVPLDQALQIGWQIAQALDYAHEQHIIHRDIKPSNIMVETKPDGEAVARLLDFGLAAEIRSSMGRVSREVHDTSGTRPYMAPEQWAGRKQGPATDQYALAVLLCELLTGEVPFASAFETGDPMVMMNVVCNREVELPDGCPRKTALSRALAKDPSQRFSSCMEFIEVVAKSESVLKSGNVAKWRRGMAFAAIAILVIFGIVVGVWHRGSRQERQQEQNMPARDAEAEREAQEDAERKAQEEAERNDREAADAERRAREDAARKARAEEERLVRENAARKAKEIAQEKAERERKDAQEKAAKREKIKLMEGLESEIDERKDRINSILKGRLTDEWAGFDASKITMTDVRVSVKEETPLKAMSKGFSDRDTMGKIDDAVQSLEKEKERLEARLKEIVRVKGIYDARDLESRKEKCVQCHGTGIVQCAKCKGAREIVSDGSSPCPICSGDYGNGRKGQVEKEVKCPRCNGKGECFRECSACYGRGKITRRRYGARFDAVMICGACDGNKGEWETCRKCEGKGTVSTWVKCATCNGVGVVHQKVACPICSGKGRITCDRCNGKGFTYRPREGGNARR